MGWTTPTDRSTGYVVSATDWNVVEDNLTFLYGDTGWTTVASFSNSWGATASAPAYILLGRIVYLRGAMTAGTANTTAFTLPAGYRPSLASSFMCSQNGGTSGIIVNLSTTGAVQPLTSGLCWLVNVSFPVV
jgi:hypothetical protein